MKILYIPLDERPCNRLFPQFITETREDIELISPPIELLGNKKKTADVNKLWEYIFSNIKYCDYAVLSIDMLVYGGLIPSRLHYLEKEEAKRRINNIKELKKYNKEIKVYAFNCIMRSPQYNSSEEEPEYYAEYGYNLFRKAYLKDKKNRVDLTSRESEELSEIDIPEEILRDYEERRNFNVDINIEAVNLVKEKVIDFLTIPQDDSSPYGYTAIAQQRVLDYIKKYELELKINIYPGADEVGSSLIARALNDFLDRQIKIYPFYSSTLGPTIIPLYEDRPMNESLKYHVRVCNGVLVENPEKADIILAINSPGKYMQESFDQKDKLDLTYKSFRNLQDFVFKIKEFIGRGKKVIISDSAFSNGGDLTLIKYLDRLEIFDKLIAYGGWNTNCNTLGTVLSSGIYAFDSKDKSKILKHLIYRLIEDVIYQANVRQNITNNFLPKYNLSYTELKGKEEYVEEKVEKLLLNEYNKYNLSNEYKLNNFKAYLPWRRMFEVGLKFNIE
jgi:hypothetical protein